MFIWVAVLVVIIWYVFHSGSASLQAGDGVSSLEQVKLGGVKQWISIRGTDAHNPVLFVFARWSRQRKHRQAAYPTP